MMRGERTHPTYRVLSWKAAALACLSFVASATNAQEPVPQPGQGPATTKVGQINALVVAINGTKRVSMRSKRLIRSVNVEKENIARAQAIQDDPMSVLVIGLQAGTTRLRLTDDQGTEEVIDVVVELDIEVVKTVLKHAFPTANVEPIPTGTTTIVLVGNVAHAEEIEAILRVAQGVLASGLPATAQSATGGGTAGAITVVNAMTVGGVRQVQLDVVVAQVNRTELRNLGVNFTVQGTTAFGGSLIGSLAQAGQSTGSGAASTSILGARAFLDSLTPGGATNIVESTHLSRPCGRSGSPNCSRSPG